MNNFNGIIFLHFRNAFYTYFKLYRMRNKPYYEQ